MSNKDLHQIQYEHNRDFAFNGIKDNKKFIDWQITGMFYCAIHLVEKNLAALNYHPKSHEDRDDYMRNLPAYNEIKFDYKKLYNLSRKSRYGCFKLDDDDAYNAQTYLLCLEENLKK